MTRDDGDDGDSQPGETLITHVRPTACGMWR